MGFSTYAWSSLLSTVEIETLGLHLLEHAHSLLSASPCARLSDTFALTILIHQAAISIGGCLCICLRRKASIDGEFQTLVLVVGGLGGPCGLGGLGDPVALGSVDGMLVVPVLLVVILKAPVPLVLLVVLVALVVLVRCRGGLGGALGGPCGLGGPGPWW